MLTPSTGLYRHIANWDTVCSSRRQPQIVKKKLVRKKGKKAIQAFQDNAFTTYLISMLLRPSRRKCLLTFWVFIFKRSFEQKFNILTSYQKKKCQYIFSRLTKITFSFNFENHAKIFSKHRFVELQFGREISKLRVIFFYSY